MSGASVEIHLCGRFSVTIGGRPLDDALGSPQLRMLFAYLVLARPHSVRRDELGEALWWDDPPASLATRIAPPLSRLRRIIEPVELHGTKDLSLELPPDTWIDWEAAHAAIARAAAARTAGDLETLRVAAGEAVTITGGRLLPDLEAPWIDERRRELADLRVEALEGVAVAASAPGADLAAAEAAARAAVEAAPFRESAYGALMEVLRLRGNVAEALRVHESLRTFLRDELGTAPGSRIAALHERLLHGDQPPRTAAPAAPAAAPRPARRAGPPVVERDRELRELSAALRETTGGFGRVIAIEGPAGIGKSRLLQEVELGAAAESATVLSAHGSRLERDYSFGIVRQLFEPVVTDPARRDELLSGPAAPARAIFSTTAADGAPEAIDASFAALHALFWLTLGVAADTPLVVTVDDLQWADRPSLRFLAYVARRIESTPALVAVAVRSGEPPTDAALLSEIAHDTETLTIHPAPLSVDAVRQIVRDGLGVQLQSPPTQAPLLRDSAFVAACHRATGGNPLLVRQLVRALEADRVEPTDENAHFVDSIGPRVVGRSVLARIARLDGDPVSVARAVAVLGENAGLPAIAKLAELPEDRVATTVAALARAEILRHDPPIGFVHALVRDAVYEELPAGERDLQHTRAARVLADLGASPEQVSAHLLVVAPRGDEDAYATLHTAARSAMARGTADNAVTYLTRALAEPPPPDKLPEVLFELGAAEIFQSSAKAIEHMRAAYDLVPDPVGRARIADALGRVMLLGVTPEEVVTFTAEARAPLAGNDDSEVVELSRSLEAIALHARHFGGGDAAALDRLDAFGDPSLRGGMGTRRLQAVAAYQVSRGGGHVDDCAELALAALGAGDLLDDDVFGAVALHTLVVCDRDEAMHAFDEWLRKAHEKGSAFTGASIALFRGHALGRRGEVVEAAALLGDAFTQLEAWGHMSPRMWTSSYYAEMLIERGELDEAERILDLVTHLPERGDGPVIALAARMQLLLARADAQGAADIGARIAARPGLPVNPAHVQWRPLHAIALAALGRDDEAVTTAESALTHAREFGSPRAIGLALRALGTARRDDGLEQFEESVRLLAGSPARLEYAKSLAALGSALRLRRRPSDAREPLREALALAEVSGAIPLADHVRTELQATGARPRTHALQAVEALTASERRVADLAAGGLSNRDIAAELFVTPKTVEVHLTNAYRKLEIRSRRELAGALAQDPQD